MKYLYKYIENIKYTVKEELSEEERDSIIDLFILYISDNYPMEFFEEGIPDPNDDITSKSNWGYKYSDKVFILTILVNNSVIKRNFVSDMKLFKDRLLKFGYLVEGGYRNPKYFNVSNPEYILSIVKPMFKTIKRKLKIDFRK